MEIPERSVHFLEVGGGITVAAVVCEDLARLDGVAELLRSVGPTLVMTLLLDGPQLASRWTSRYAGVLADDPGSAVLTLTALGMATRSQPRGMPPSRVVAMWKDPARGVREIPMDPGAQGVLLKAVVDRSARYAADGRQPADDVTDFYIAGVHQLRAEPRAGTSRATAAVDTEPAVAQAPLATRDLSVVSAWAQAIADALAAGGSQVDTVLMATASQSPWRADAGLDTPTGELAGTLDALVRLSHGARDAGGDSAAAWLASLDATSADGLDEVARVSLIAALEVAGRS
jgi:hypothetical protein